MARPMPRAAPVTMATRAVRSIRFIGSSFVFGSPVEPRNPVSHSVF